MKSGFYITTGLLISIFSFAQKGGKYKLWYDKPAKQWVEALPVGNGNIAAMVYGDPYQEKLQLNEGTFWSGGPSRNDNPDAPKVLDSIRYYLFNGNYKRAQILADKGLTAKTVHGSAFQNIGDFTLDMDNLKDIRNYYRELDIEKAIAATTFTSDGVNFKREVFASIPDHVIVIKLSSDHKNALNFTAKFNSELKKEVKAIDATTLQMDGVSSTLDGIQGQVKFSALAKLMTKGGKTQISESGISVSNAHEVTILIAMATNFTDYKNLNTDEVAKARKYIEAAANKSFKTLVQNHLNAYQNYFKRVDLNLGTSEAAKNPTDVRIKNFATGYDPELISLYYQFGRYLLISSSQPGGQPANLQGIWNNSNKPAWDSKYTININTEMNYWPAEKTNLPEMYEPLIRMIKDLSETGKETAKTMYNSRGWVAHHNTDIWRITGVVDFANAGMWPMGGAWLSQHLWEKYLYSGDKNYLRTIYPVLKSAAQFYEDFLIEEPANHWLVASPSMSPENIPQGHQGSALAAGNTMDNQLMFDLFTKTKKAAQILNTDSDKIQVWNTIISKLPPMKIGSYGQLQEWMEDLDDPKDNHRHVSHLYGLFPSNQISPFTTPELLDASRTVLVHRGDVSTGWSMGWKVNLWAKLLDGNHADKLIKDQLTLVEKDGWGSKGGTYPNLFDAHPPFQIDGNFGCTSGITEMLLQTQNGFIDILPALPDEWKNGSISGLKVYGGFEVSIIWENNKAKEITIKSGLGGNCRIRLPNEMKLSGNIKLKKAEGKNPNSFFEIPETPKPLISDKAKLNPVEIKTDLIYDFPTEAGKVYTLRWSNKSSEGTI
ncbi:glycoside hydrolase family 95 protein [Chryseobacterium sp. B21-037]|uniref:glycoside hydrolase family 95 protein n=1 Tax=Chryseobacterium sp. B21-037 TaxID=2926038 RepID=UPI0023587CD3|nr:glycoside hydrolase family 95 protein [Chryseobacterium sp. B21-037]MDC8103513.1 glycoside hydrolase family 95 protein [Chryseobacterium sp. B21-037]